MRNYGTTPRIPVPPDTVVTHVVALGVAQAADWPAGTNIVRFVGLSTANTQMQFYAHPWTTAAAIPAAGTSVSTANGGNVAILGEAEFQRPRGSTGYSVVANSSGYIHALCWGIHG